MKMGDRVLKLNGEQKEIWTQNREGVFSLHENYVHLFSDSFTNSSTCEFVSLPFLQHFSNPNPLDYTDDLNGERISLVDLWENLLSVGMQNPFIFRLCNDPMSLRLETGNQRITIFAAKGIIWVPCDLQIAKSPIGHEGNGKHFVLIEDSLLKTKSQLQPGTYKPSDYLNQFIQAKKFD